MIQAEPGDQFQPALVEERTHARSELPAFFELVVPRAAQELSHRRTSDRPDDGRLRILSRELGQIEQGV